MPKKVAMTTNAIARPDARITQAPVEKLCGKTTDRRSSFVRDLVKDLVRELIRYITVAGPITHAIRAFE